MHSKLGYCVWSMYTLISHFLGFFFYTVSLGQSSNNGRGSMYIFLVLQAFLVTTYILRVLASQNDTPHKMTVRIKHVVA